jgi:hypothetical protein
MILRTRHHSACRWPPAEGAGTTRRTLSVVRGARTAPDIGTQRYAIGLDLGAPLLEVARRGFSSTFSNQMRQLGGWISSAPAVVPTGAEGGVGDDAPFTTVLHLADDLAGTLAAREAGESEQLTVGLAAPGWLGWCDRHHITQLVDPHGTCQLVWVSSPMAAAVGTNLAGGTPFIPELVVAIDLDLGITASVISIERTGVREMVSACAPPTWSPRPDAVASVIAEVAALAHEAGLASIARVVLVATAGGASAVVEHASRALDRTWADCPVEIVGSRAHIARATVLMADIESFEIVCAAPRNIGVLVDDADTGPSSMHVILARNTPVPGRCVSSFDLGPDDGAEVYLDVYEDHVGSAESAGCAADRRGHRLVMTARLDGDAFSQRSETVDVSFVVGADGVLCLEAATEDKRVPWTCTWAASTIVMPSSALSAAAGARAAASGSGGRQVAQIGRLLAAPRISASATPSRRSTREMAPPIGLAEALGRAERIVSREVGRLVAIRSAMALLGCADRDDLQTMLEAADRLASALERCPGNDAARALHVALDVVRRALRSPAARLYAGGNEHEVSRELERVVEHLSIVIGGVTPAERNRLVLDGQLLGFDHHRARTLVDQLIDDAQVDSDGAPDELRDPTALVMVTADGLRLAALGAHHDADQVAIRVLVFDP